ncbi:MAG: hypothetical protein MUP97_10220 [Acidimicrobiia bacterium]|nr:hypothetical protein [Acidimicrobiia bacterium]
MFRKLATVLVATAAFGTGAAGLIASPAAAKSSGNTLEVQAAEYAYTLKGSPHAGWVTIKFDNLGQENHALAIFQVKPSVTAKQIKAAVIDGSDAAFGKLALGDPNRGFGTPDLIGPGESTETVSQLPAGHFGVLCYIPAPDVLQHAAHGMITTIDVETPKSKAKAPKTDTEVTLTDSAITIPDGGMPQQFSAKVTNTGTTSHGFTLVRLEPGQTIDTVFAYYNDFFATGKATGPAPGVVVGGIYAVDPGKTGYLVQKLTPGHYGYASTVQGEPPNDDFSKGLKGEFDVK